MAALGAEGVGVVQDGGDAALLVEGWERDFKTFEPVPPDGRLADPGFRHRPKDSPKKLQSQEVGEVAGIELGQVGFGAA